MYSDSAPEGGNVKNSRVWRIFWVIYFASVVVAMSQFKVPPLMGELLAFFHTTPSVGAWLMSSFSVAGIVLGIPAALIFGKLGPRRAGAIALTCALLGNLLGALSGSVGILIAARVLEGISYSMLTVIAPAVLATWFGPEKVAVPMGIWSTWVPVGMLGIFTAAVPMSSSLGGWRAAWWCCALLAAVALALYVAVVREPEAAPAAEGNQQAPLPLGKALLSGPAWVLGATYGFFCAAMLSLITWTPTYIEAGLGFAAGPANALAATLSIGLIVGGFVAGAVIGNSGTPGAVLRLAMLACAVLFVWGLGYSAGIAMPYLIVVGIVLGLVPPAVYTLAPQTMASPEAAGFAMGILSVCQNIGFVVGTGVIGGAIGSLSAPRWLTGSLIMVGLLGVGFLITLRVRSGRRTAQVGVEAA